MYCADAALAHSVSMHHVGGWRAYLAQPVAIDGLANAMRVSYRTLNRRFVEITGMAPLAYLQAL